MSNRQGVAYDADNLVTLTPGSLTYNGATYDVAASGSAAAAQAAANAALIAAAAAQATANAALPKAGGTMTGQINMSNQKIVSLGTPTVSTDAATKGYVDTSVVGLLDLQGTIDCSANPNYPPANKGDVWVVSVAGLIGGGAGISVQAGDALVALADNPGGTQAAVGSSWSILQANLVGALLAVNNLSDVQSVTTARNNLGLGSVATLTADTDGTLAANSDSRVATQKATKTYADTKLALTGGTVTGDLSISNNASLLMTQGGIYNLSRTIPTTVGDAVALGSFTTTDFSGNLDIWYNCHSNTFAQAKRYFLPLSYNKTANTWQKIMPVSSTFAYAGNDADLEINVNNAVASLRLRRTSGTTAGIADFVIMVGGSSSVTPFTPSTTVTVGATTPTAIYQVNAEGQLTNFLGVNISSIPYTNRPQFLINPAVIDAGSFSMNNWNGTGRAIPIVSVMLGNNGGSTPATGEPALVLARPGIGGQAYGNFVEFRVRRWENVGAQARSCLDIGLTNGNGDAAGTVVFTAQSNGNCGANQTAPTARLHIGAGTATANTAPLKFTSGTNLSAPEAGAMEYNGTLSFTASTAVRKDVALKSTYTPTLTPAAIAAAGYTEQTFTVTGLTTSDTVVVNGPAAAANTVLVHARVSAVDTLALTWITSAAATPTSGTYRIVAIRS